MLHRQFGQNRSDSESRRIIRPCTQAHPLEIWVFKFALSRLESSKDMWSLFKEFLKFCNQEKKWWLIPLIILLLVLGAILIFTASSGIAWALYPFM